jgi:Zn-dependent membrane protease YugP
MFFDPTYWIVILAGMLLSGWAAMTLKATFHRYGQVPTRRGLSGAEVAQRILLENGIHDVAVEPVHGNLTDHYDPRTKTLRLSEAVYGSRDLAAAGVAAHEVGHAIQHARGYGPLGFRSFWVPVASFGSQTSILVLILAAVMGGAATAAGHTLALIGIVLFATTTLFTLITLPVEFDASRRALATLEQGSYLTPDELTGARKVLNAAAMTYVAAFLTSLLTLLYWAHRLGLFGGRREE